MQGLAHFPAGPVIMVYFLHLGGFEKFSWAPNLVPVKGPRKFARLFLV